MKQYYTVTEDADMLAPKWLASRVDFIYRIIDGAGKLKGVKIGHETAQIGDVVSYDGKRLSVERQVIHYLPPAGNDRDSKGVMHLIEVSVRKDGITVSGHAGYAEVGKDIVCAGVTALTQTLIKSVSDLTEDKIQCEVSPGKANIHYRDLSEAGKLLVDSFFIGICMIADEFPECVRVA